MLLNLSGRRLGSLRHPPQRRGSLPPVQHRLDLGARCMQPRAFKRPRLKEFASVSHRDSSLVSGVFLNSEFLEAQGGSSFLRPFEKS